MPPAVVEPTPSLLVGIPTWKFIESLNLMWKSDDFPSEIMLSFNLSHKWVFAKIGVPQNGWFIMENPIKMDDLGVPLFLETPKWSKLVGL